MNRTLIARSILALAGLALSPALTSAATPVGFVVELKGQVVVNRMGQDQPARLFYPLHKGDRLTIPDAALITVAFRKDGSRERIDSTGTAIVQEAKLQPDEETKITRTQRDAPRIATTIVRIPPNRRPGVLRVRSGEGSAPQRIHPIDGSVVTDDRPTFSWPKANQAGDLTLRVRQGSEALWESAVQSDHQQAIYAGKDRLRPGVFYSWSVIQPNEDPVESARLIAKGGFSVATDEQRKFAEPWSEPDQIDDVPMLSIAALALYEEGLIAQSVKLLERIIELDPENGEFHAVLADVYQRAGRFEDADKHYKDAMRLGVEISDGADSETP